MRRLTKRWLIAIGILGVLVVGYSFFAAAQLSTMVKLPGLFIEHAMVGGRAIPKAVSRAMILSGRIEPDWEGHRTGKSGLGYVAAIYLEYQEEVSRAYIRDDVRWMATLAVCRGSDPNQFIEVHPSFTEFHVAVLQGDAWLVSLLLELGANPAVPNRSQDARISGRDALGMVEASLEAVERLPHPNPHWAEIREVLQHHLESQPAERQFDPSASCMEFGA